MIKATKNITIVRKDEGNRDGIYYAPQPYIGIVVDSNTGFNTGDRVVFKDGFEFTWDNVNYVALDLFEILAVVA